MSEQYTPSLEELSDYYIEGRLQMHDGFQPANEEQFDRAIDKIKADAIREAASGLIDWDVMYGDEAETLVARVSHSNVDYLMRIADELEQ